MPADRIYIDNLRAAVKDTLLEVVAGLRDAMDEGCVTMRLDEKAEFEFRVVHNRLDMEDQETSPGRTVTKTDKSPSGDIVSETTEAHEGQQISENTQETTTGGKNTTTTKNWWHSVDDSVITPT